MEGTTEQEKKKETREQRHRPSVKRCIFNHDEQPIRLSGSFSAVTDAVRRTSVQDKWQIKRDSRYIVLYRASSVQKQRLATLSATFSPEKFRRVLRPSINTDCFLNCPELVSKLRAIVLQEIVTVASIITPSLRIILRYYMWDVASHNK